MAYLKLKHFLLKNAFARAIELQQHQTAHKARLLHNRLTCETNYAYIHKNVLSLSQENGIACQNETTSADLVKFFESLVLSRNTLISR